MRATHPSLNAFCLALFVISGCSAVIAQGRFEREYKCPTSFATDLGGGAVRVEGCGYRATYVCITGNQAGPTCVKEEAAGPPQERPATSRANSKLTQGGAGATPSQAGVQRSKHADGFTLIAFTTELVEPQTNLNVTAGPARDSEHVLLVFSRSRSRGALQGCPLRAAVNGQPVMLPEVHYRAERGVEQLRMRFPVAQLAEWARAQRIVAQACDVRFELDEQAINLIREFLMLFQEELALNGSTPPAKAGPAPSDSL